MLYIEIVGHFMYEGDKAELVKTTLSRDHLISFNLYVEYRCDN